MDTALEKLTHACAVLQPSQRCNRVEMEVLRRKKSLTVVEQCALEVLERQESAVASFPTERVVELLHAIGDEDSQHVLQRWNAVRARKAGLVLKRKQEQEGRNELEEEHAKYVEVFGSLENAEREVEKSRQKARALEKQFAESTEYCSDIRAVAMQGDPAHYDDDLGEKAERVCANFEAEATQFEQQKRKACEESSELREMASKVSHGKASLHLLQVERNAKERSKKRLYECTRNIIAANAQKNNMARALDILLLEGGEMHLQDWKAQIAEALQQSQAKTIQLVYGLVANSLVSIDRSQAEARVISRVQL